jgi:predicted small metal-binding protein
MILRAGDDAEDRVMTKVLKCADLMPGCPYEARGMTTEDILQQAAVHARDVHNIAPSPELVEKVKSAIREE